MTTRELVVAVIVYVSLAIPTLVHAAFFKRHSRAALGWIAFIVSAPVLGGVLYLLFGVNRVRLRSRSIRSGAEAALRIIDELAAEERALRAESWGAEAPLPDVAPAMIRIGAAVTDAPLVPGNAILPLHHGEEMFPELLAAIAAAKKRVWLTTYIFDTDALGLLVIDALIAAHQRGVDVRVVVDGVGQLNGGGLRPASMRLRKAGVAVVRFLPPRLLPPQVYINMRNHRKVIVVDGEVAFSGGMNIGGRHLIADPWTPRPVQDLHFRLRGPIVRDLEWLFLQDWAFALEHERRRRFRMPSRELLRGLRKAPLSLPNDAREDSEAVLVTAAALPLAERTRRIKEGLRIQMRSDQDPAAALEGLSDARRHYLTQRMAIRPSAEAEVHGAWCRLVVDGPDLELNRLEMLISGVVAAAERRVFIVTPYFLPTESITASLAAAAMRGVDVRVIIPERSNEPLVEHAMYRMLVWLLRRGVRVLRQPGPFVHTKLILVDDAYVQMGSTNLDPRSLRLNFEHVIEIYSQPLVRQLEAHFAPVLDRCQEIREEDVRKRPWYTKSADAFCWLFSPYL